MKRLEASAWVRGSSSPGNATDPLASDFALFALLKSGREDVMASLFDRYSKLVYSTALRVLRDTAGAEDVTQEIFMQLWRKPPAIPVGGESLAGWFVLIARNRAISVLRKRRDLCSIDEVLTAAPFDLFREAEKNNLLECLRTAMAEFPFDQKRTLDMAFFEGLTHGEIAASTGQALGTVKSRIRKALLVLREQFQQQPPSEVPIIDLPPTEDGGHRRVDASLPELSSRIEKASQPGRRRRYSHLPLKVRRKNPAPIPGRELGHQSTKSALPITR